MAAVPQSIQLLAWEEGSQVEDAETISIDFPGSGFPQTGIETVIGADVLEVIDEQGKLSAFL